MFIIKIIGGLGNQMFQYALGLSLSIKFNTEFKMDISGFDLYKLHNYSMQYLNINEHMASKSDLSKYNNSLSKIKSKILPYYWRPIIRERQFNFDQKILNLKKNAYLDGYWQSEKYFKNIEYILRKEFTIKDEFNTIEPDLKNRIINSNSVSVHVRRKDYVSADRTHQVHGTCSKEYYQKAINYISSKIKNIKIFVFSDDIKWAEKNIIFNFRTEYIDHGIEKNYIDLALMSMCKHNIIANSSFSWWGAWLNANSNKIVITPNEWFKDKTKNTKDVIPKKWTKL